MLLVLLFCSAQCGCSRPSHHTEDASKLNSTRIIYYGNGSLSRRTIADALHKFDMRIPASRAKDRAIWKPNTAIVVDLGTVRFRRGSIALHGTAAVPSGSQGNDTIESRTHRSLKKERTEHG